MLEKTFNPKDVEERLYEAWEKSGAFRAGNRPDATPFTMVIPPPNVTGSLHVGHALNNTLQDILARFERMRGKDVLWQPGTDHAGIATQLVVERQLREAQTSRQALGREAFIERVWEWKAESGGTITRQQRRLGSSCDWSRERFTMDEGLSRAVIKVFVELHRQGLMYKDTRLVNWDPSLQTAVSDLEVENIEIKGNLWHLKYPLADDAEQFIVVATTRPETMLADQAVAVHPDDERYKALVGRMVRLPLTGRLVPIIADEYANPEKGSGAVKITPGHDFNDYEVGRRHNLAVVNMFTPGAKLGPDVPEAYRGLDRFVARKKIVADMEALGLLEKVEPVTHAVPHDEKSKTIELEPMLTEQWYLNVKPLAEKAMGAVRDGRTKFIPQRFEDEYFRWLEDIRPWCVSRQLWWGHQIPAWYDADGHVFVAETEADALAAARSKHGRDVALTRDPDVLDTWFSSALWPFSTLGWPDATPEMKRHYKTDVLVTMFDIIFFWVARMMMMGLHFMNEVPFKRVIINGLVRDEKGQKMSKSKGNVIDPLGIIDELGADPLRFTMAILSGTRDIKLSKQRIEGYRNFGTKLWNAARFSQMNGCARVEGFDPATVEQTINRWIRGELTKAERAVSEAIEGGRFDDAAGALYRFVWNVFCDWYLELAKPIFQGSDEAAKAETRAMTAWTLDQTLKLLHPVMPFITEELWAELGKEGPARETLLIGAEWPVLPDGFIDAAAEAEIGWLVDLVGEIRGLRAEMNVPPSAKPPLAFVAPDAATAERIARHRDLILTLGRVSEVGSADAAPTGAVTFVSGGSTAALSLAGIIDLTAERARLEKEIAVFDADIAHVNKKLGNPNFVSRAAPDVVEEQRAKLAEAEAGKVKLQAALARLSEIG